MSYHDFPGWKYEDEYESGQGTSRKVAEAGGYTIKLVDLTPKPSSTDKPMIVAKFEIVGTETPALRDGIGAKVYDNWLVVTGEGFRVDDFCAVATLDPPKSQRPEDIIEFCERADGTTVEAIITKRATPNGTMRNEIRHYGTVPPELREDGQAKSRNNGGRDGPRRGKDAQAAPRAPSRERPPKPRAAASERR